MQNLIIIVIGRFFLKHVFQTLLRSFTERTIITDIGLDNTVPFMELQGQPGGSFSISGGDESYYAYTFVTDKGIFADSVALNEDGYKPYYGVDHFDIKEFQIGEFVNHKTVTGEPKFRGNLAMYIPKDIVITNVSKAYTLQIIPADPDDDCDSGEHIYKIFSSK